MRTHSPCVCLCIGTNAYHCFPWFVCIIIHCVCLSLCLHSFLCLDMHPHICPCMCTCVRACLCLDLYINQQCLMLFPSIGWALPSHYTGSTTNHRLCVSVSHNLPLFSLLSLVIFLLHSVRQLPSPTDPQSTLITFSSRVYSISLALLSISLLFFFLSLSLLSVTLLCAPSSCLLIFCQVSTLLIAHCFMLYVSLFVFLSP